MGAVSVLPNWYRPSGPRSIDDIAEAFLRLFVGGIVAEHAR
jgi:hypothetical protein